MLLLCFWVIREINSRFCSKTQWQMFLLVSGRHVGAHVDGHQHGVSIQISINLGKTFLRISSMRKIAVTWILARVFVYVPSFYFQILDLIYSTVLIFYFDLFWMAWHWKPAIESNINELNELISRNLPRSFGFLNCFDNVNWPPSRDWNLFTVGNSHFQPSWSNQIGHLH